VAIRQIEQEEKAPSQSLRDEEGAFSRRNLSLSSRETRRTSAKAPDLKVEDVSA
jgi:hypothetical protein